MRTPQVDAIDEAALEIGVSGTMCFRYLDTRPISFHDRAASIRQCAAIAFQALLPQRQIKEPWIDSTKMKIIDEMLNLDLLTHEQHLQISAWIARSSSPEEILQMPPQLWQAVERASQTMGINEDLLRPPSLDADDVIFS